MPQPNSASTTDTPKDISSSNDGYVEFSHTHGFSPAVPSHEEMFLNEILIDRRRKVLWIQSLNPCHTIFHLPPLPPFPPWVFSLQCSFFCAVRS